MLDLGWFFNRPKKKKVETKWRPRASNPIEVDVDREPANSGLSLWYPDAEVKKGQKVRGTYPQGYPEGAIIHFTAGRRTYHRNTDKYESGEMAIDYSVNTGKYAYFIIGMDGTVWQSVPLDKWGSHAGNSYHPALDDNWISKRCVGIEICNAGPLTKVGSKYKAWFNSSFVKNNVRVVNKRDYPNCTRDGAYLKFTKSQEESLTELLLWLRMNNQDVFKLANVYGHDEVSPTRKNDPGGSLSMSMEDYRAYLIRRYREE